MQVWVGVNTGRSREDLVGEKTGWRREELGSRVGAEAYEGTEWGGVEVDGWAK